MSRQDEAMQETKTGNTVKKRHDHGTLIEVLLVRPPGPQGTAGHVKHLRRLTLGHPLGFEVAIALKPPRAFEATSVLVAIIMATLLVLNYCSHSYLLFKPRSWDKCMAQDGEVALVLQPCTMPRR